MVHLVTYDLKKPGQDYTSVHDAIKGCGSWWHYLESTWLVDSRMTAEQISAKVRRHMDENDRLLVIAVSGDHAGWLPQAAWDWINSHVPQYA
ncbi:MAG: hypothetical protein JSS38_11245 [Nitrospira sp.]|nr:hypothetical protein [Nitrospira sp.]